MNRVIETCGSCSFPQAFGNMIERLQMKRRPHGRLDELNENFISSGVQKPITRNKTGLGHLFSF